MTFFRSSFIAYLTQSEGLFASSLKKSGNSKYDKASAKEYGLWDVPKCYIHLYPENQIIFDWSMPLSAFGGRTAFDVADEAWHCHLSQQKS